MFAKSDCLTNKRRHGFLNTYKLDLFHRINMKSHTANLINLPY